MSNLTGASKQEVLVPQIVARLSEGDAEAILVCMKLHLIDKRNKLGPLQGPISFLSTLDALQIYGKRINELYENICSKDIRRLCAVLCGWSRGIVPADYINREVDNPGSGCLDVDDVLRSESVRHDLLSIGMGVRHGS
jgi:hypothetical protein